MSSTLRTIAVLVGIWASNSLWDKSPITKLRYHDGCVKELRGRRPHAAEAADPLGAGRVGARPDRLQRSGPDRGRGRGGGRCLAHDGLPVLPEPGGAAD